jgi:hypothetical protein
VQRQTMAVCLLALSLAACASGPKFYGNTVADSRLRNDTSAIVVGVAMAKTKCKTVDSISTSVVSVPKDIQGNSAGKIVGGGDIVERWVATACGQTAPFLVTFTPDGQGGSYMSVKAE